MSQQFRSQRDIIREKEKAKGRARQVEKEAERFPRNQELFLLNFKDFVSPPGMAPATAGVQTLQPVALMRGLEPLARVAFMVA